jgi:4a-hydroxytetrahydrobiopterin dehydratase
VFAIEYHAGVRMIVDVAAAAKAMEHHPDLALGWGRVAFMITTHDAGNRVTELDFPLAERIDVIAAEHGAGVAPRDE